MKKIRVLVADDEPLARQKLRNLLRKDPEIELVAEAINGKETLDSIRQFRPDLLFLDVQMPGADGFQVLESLDLEAAPYVIFVTAYDQYAIKAFEVHALDYLLKPFDRQRFLKTLEHAKEEISKTRENHSKHLLRLIIKSEGCIFLLKVNDIDWIGAEGNYISIHSGKESYLLRQTISSVESRLDPSQFLRIHKSTIIRIDRIRELQPWFHGEYRVVLHDGTEFMLSRTYREKFLKILSG